MSHQPLVLILKSHQKPLSTAVQPLYLHAKLKTHLLWSMSLLNDCESPVCVLSAHKFRLSRPKSHKSTGILQNQTFVSLFNNLPRPVKLNSTCFTSCEHLIWVDRSLIRPLDSSPPSLPLNCWFSPTHFWPDFCDWAQNKFSEQKISKVRSQSNPPSLYLWCLLVAINHYCCIYVGGSTSSLLPLASVDLCFNFMQLFFIQPAKNYRSADDEPFYNEANLSV